MTIRRRFSTTLTIVLSSAALVLGAMACSSSADQDIDETDEQDESKDGKGGKGGKGSKDSYTLDNVCEKMAEKECASAASCCGSSGIGYDQEACEKASRKACGKTVAKVRAGKMAFDPTAVDKCLDAKAKRYEKCKVTIFDDWDIDARWSCSSIFKGAVVEGGACEDIEECAAPTEENTAAFCFYGTCDYAPSNYTEVGKGEECGSMKTFCERGLYCAPVSEPDSIYAGRCDDAKEIGEACEGYESDECLSWNCVNGRCAEPEKYFVATPEVCKGEVDASGD